MITTNQPRSSVTSEPPPETSQRSGSGPTFSPQVRGYYQTVLAGLQWPSSGAEKSPLALGLTSAYRGEGVSTVAAQLAVTAAGLGPYRVVLVELQPQRNSQVALFGLPPTVGLTDVLRQDCSLDDALRPTLVGGLSLLSAGQRGGAGAEIADHSGAIATVDALRERFDLIVFDMPSASASAQTGLWAAPLDGLLLVVEAERVRWEVAQRTAALLRRSGANLLGVVLNKRREHVPRWLYRTL